MLNEFLDGYIEAALFSSLDDHDQPLDSNYSADDLAAETLAQFKIDCQTFYNQNYDAISNDIKKAGIDFWFTRTGAGAGFWDGDWPEHGDALTEASHRFGELGLIVGEDGLIYSC